MFGKTSLGPCSSTASNRVAVAEAMTGSAHTHLTIITSPLVVEDENMQHSILAFPCWPITVLQGLSEHGKLTAITQEPTLPSLSSEKDANQACQSLILGEHSGTGCIGRHTSESGQREGLHDNTLLPEAPASNREWQRMSAVFCPKVGGTYLAGQTYDNSAPRTKRLPLR